MRTLYAKALLSGIRGNRGGSQQATRAPCDGGSIALGREHRTRKHHTPIAIRSLDA